MEDPCWDLMLLLLPDCQTVCPRGFQVGSIRYLILASCPLLNKACVYHLETFAHVRAGRNNGAVVGEVPASADRRRHRLRAVGRVVLVVCHLTACSTHARPTNTAKPHIVQLIDRMGRYDSAQLGSSLAETRRLLTISGAQLGARLQTSGVFDLLLTMYFFGTSFAVGLDAHHEGKILSTSRASQYTRDSASIKRQSLSHGIELG
ncbi:hypothetical protein BV25DRAFT_1463723 [Artomyces pyxidatus]|uniref:Uncharacterized protein n=1 Tax=Artomyces pyxidatus TaxID=48021 RepID=A0ACB8SLP7_9AGAM|nr:hypothetical protein BV25DRAFT_1463723 [Artomyces pyxidatus]